MSIDKGASVTIPAIRKILQRRTSTTYRFPFLEKYEGREGEADVAISVKYGQAGQPPTRLLTQDMRVPFKPRGAMTVSSCFNRKHDEQAI